MTFVSCGPKILLSGETPPDILEVVMAALIARFRPTTRPAARSVSPDPSVEEQAERALFDTLRRDLGW